MIDLQQKLQANILDRLKRRKDQRLRRGEFNKAIEAIQKQFPTDTNTIQQSVEALLREAYVKRTFRGAYELQKKGAEYLVQIMSTLVSPPPDINEELIPSQKAFVLMQLFCADENTLTQSDLFKKLEHQAVKESGLFLRLSADPPANPDRPTVEWVLTQLSSGNNIREQKRGRSVRYWLTERGQELLAVTDLPRIKGYKYTLTGEQLNVLREAVRHAGHLDSPMREPRPHPREVEATAPPPAPFELKPDMVLNAFEELRRERFARNGIVPVYELRRLLIARHGAQAGSHTTLDPLLKQMRREKRMRMIAIGDLSEATTDQLDDSVPGENETFFYLETAHEYANAR